MPLAAMGAAVALLAASPVFAQQPRPLPIAAFDIRGFYSKLGQDPATAVDLGVTAADLPGRGLGGVAGIHLYPLRFRPLTIGIGAEGILAHGRRAFEADENSLAETDTTLLRGPVHQRVLGLAGVVSLNFGHREGWSYVSAGMGPMSFITYEGSARPAERPPVQNTLNFGGGARWFSRPHLAFAVDVRFYQTRPEVQTASYPRRQRSTLMVMSAGIAFK